MEPVREVNMKTWQFAAVGLLAIVLAGCRTDPNIALVEQESFRKDVEITRLQNQLEDCQAELEIARNSCQGSRGTRRVEPEGERSPDLPAPENAAPAARPPAVPSRPAPVSPPPGETAPPAIELPNQPLPEGQIPDRFKVPSGPAKPDSAPPPWNPPNPPSTRVPAGGAAEVAQRVAASRDVAQITLNRALTGGLAASDRPGDQGLMVVVEPRDVQGRLIDALGDLRVTAIDPTSSGPAAQAGRWEFTAAETAVLPSGGPGGGIHLNLPWPDGPPTSHQLRLKVSYVTADGRRLEREVPVEVALAGDPAAGRGSPPADAPAAWSPDSSRIRTATGTASPAPPRPVWSPERM